MNEITIEINNLTKQFRNTLAVKNISFRINKGKENLSDSINAHMAEKNRPIPFDNMIYIGDGMTDVPSMALIKKEGGHAIAVYMNSQKNNLLQHFLKTSDSTFLKFLARSNHHHPKSKQTFHLPSQLF